MQNAAAMPGGKAVSIGRVAERAGVSIATVSRVLNGVANKATPETMRRVRAAAKELGYRPMSVGRALRQQRSRLVAVLAANLGNPAMAAIAASIETALRARGLVMVLCDTHDRPDLQDEYLLEMRAQLAHSIVLLGAVKSRELQRAVRDDLAVVYVNRHCPYGSARPFVGIDNHAAGAEVARGFLHRGIRDLAVIHADVASSATAQRLDGFCAALAEAGVVLTADRVLTAATSDHLSLGYGSAQKLLSGARLPAGIFCLSDLIAWGVHRRLVEAGTSPLPFLVGFDGSPINAWLAPWLVSVRVPYEEFGEAIADAIRFDAKGERAALLKHRLDWRVDVGGT